jgi:peptidoglycan/LPS O-acetylase OafA/YrhL
MDTIAVGCLLGVTVRDSGSRARFDDLVSRDWLLFLAIGVLLLTPFVSWRLATSVGYTAYAVCIAALLYASLSRDRSYVGRMLNHRLLNSVGVGSYSIYLWQQLFLRKGANSFCCGFPQNILFAFLAAFASYQLIEKPFVRLKDRVGKASRNPGAAVVHQRPLARDPPTVAK